MRRNKSSLESEQPDRDLLDHMKSLKLDSVDEYQLWCDRNGFGRRLHKHWKQRCRERFHAKEAVAKGRLGQLKREKRKLNEVLLDVCSGRLKEDDVAFPYLKRLCQALRPGGQSKNERQVDRQSLHKLLTRLHECRAKLFDGSSVIEQRGELPGNTYIEALALIAAHSPAWLRPISEWMPRSHNAGRQFASLLRHLFVKYEVPSFFDSVWFSGRTESAAERRKWYLHVGRGRNIRNCQLPITLTRKMAHNFMQAPNNATIEQALRWGQVLSLGGNERLARAIFGTRLTESFENEAFWSSVIRWFVAHPMLDRAHVGPIIDYLYHQRFVAEILYVGPDRREEFRPAQPDLTMNGRTPEALLRRVNEWHRSLVNDNRHEVRQWTPHGLEEFEFVEGSERGDNLKIWTIRELLSSKALMTEGRQMKHCVASYASSCARGQCSIWTMEVESLDGRSKVLTIEVRRGVQLICQVRGKGNRIANEKEKRIIRRWAESSGLRLASYV